MCLQNVTKETPALYSKCNTGFACLKYYFSRDISCVFTFWHVDDGASANARGIKM